ncbi:MAG: hypothetical protein FJX74_08565 [Armatimonadetes bacterium]|nr:hypothetical protein [Armatimonadota bacterium]
MLDIRATVGGAPPDLGVTAGRLVAAAFAATGKYEVVDYDLVRAELAKRDLRPPFGVGHLQLLADVLDADLVVHGAVRSLTFDTQRGSAAVVLSLEVVDGPTGNLRKRAETTGSEAATGEGMDQGAVTAAALAAAVLKAVETVTGLPAQVEPPKVTVPRPEELPGAGASRPEASAPAPGPQPALLPPMEAGESAPRTTTPAADLRPGAPPRPQSSISVIVTPRPQTGGRAGEASPPAGGRPAVTPPPPGKVTVLPEPPEAEVLVEEGADETLAPLLTAKILAKTAGDRVLITLGRGSAVTPKMELEVFRVTVSRDETTTRRRLGRIRVTKINPTDAEARILEGGPLMATGDYAYYYGP